MVKMQTPYAPHLSRRRTLKENKAGLKAASGLCIAVGLFFVAASFGIIPDDGRPPRRSPIFDHPRHWQITAIGTAFFCAGLSNLIPPRMKLLLRLNGLLCLFSFLAGLIGSFLVMK